jgi:hypothetical protein
MGVLAWLVGMAVGLVGFAAASFELEWLTISLIFAFVCFWLVGAICWVGYVVGVFSGRYRGITSKPWREQVW